MGRAVGVVWLAGWCGCAALLTEARAASVAEVGTAVARRLRPAERCSSAVRRGDGVWLGCASGVWRAGPSDLALVLPCAEEAPGAVRVRPVAAGPFEAVAASPCGLHFLAPDRPAWQAPLPGAPSLLDTAPAGDAWVVADQRLWRCPPGAPCEVRADLEGLELEDPGARLLALADGPRLWIAGRLLDPGPTWREEPSPGPGHAPLCGPRGELLWVDEAGRLRAPGVSPRPPPAPVLPGGRVVAAEGFPGGIWLADRRWFYVLREAGWVRGPLPPGHGRALPVAGELEGGLPWLLADDMLHRPAPAAASAAAWCPAASALQPGLGPGWAAGDALPGGRAWLPRLAFGLGSRRGEAAQSIGGVVARRAKTTRWRLAVGISWPLEGLVDDGLEAGRAALQRERRLAAAERLALFEELAAARDRLCRAAGGPEERLELHALDEMLAVVRASGEAP